MHPSISAAANSVTVAFDLPALRSLQIETSTDLQNWTLWDAPGNNGLSGLGGHVSLSDPAAATKQFSRVKVWEN